MVKYFILKEYDKMEENKENNLNSGENFEHHNTSKPKKKKRKMGKLILNLIITILFIIVVLEAVVGIINMQRISNKEEPIWYLDTKKTEHKLKTVTEYHLGLYKIVKTDTSTEAKITLKPFFLGD